MEEKGIPTPREQTAAYPPLTVKYNGEEKKLTYEEAVAYAQKGMNYDKIYQRLRDYEQRAASGENPSVRQGCEPKQEERRPNTDSHQEGESAEQLRRENQQLTRRLSIAMEQRENRERSTGSAKGGQESLPFVGSVGKMSLKDYEKNRERIWRDLEKRMKR